MRRGPAQLTLAALCCAACTKAADATEPPAGRTDLSTDQKCLARYQMHSGGSVLGEQRSLGPAWSDFPTRYAAAEIAKDQASVKVVSQFQISGRPLLYFTADKKSVVVDKRYFSDLAAIVVPGLT